VRHLVHFLLQIRLFFLRSSHRSQIYPRSRRVETRSRTALSPLRTVDTTIFWRAVACAVSAHLGFIARACSHGPVGRSQVGRVTPCAPILRSDAAGRGLPGPTDSITTDGWR
jgi:hypothetical protein